MDIKLTHSLIKDYLDTPASPEKISEALSLCGPTVDRLEKKGSDWIYDIEIITNRIDSASALGVAREASAILPQFDIPAKLINDPYQNSHPLKNLPNKPPVSITITDSTLIPRFACISISGVTVKPSPASTKQLLENVGERSLNNLIDITNELTIRYGQPTHIFDLDRIKGQQMLLRRSKPGEKITTLDDKTHKLDGGDIVIEDGDKRLIDLCGIMGGDLSSITSETKNVLLFVQTYDPKQIRKTSLSQQKRTLAAQLFEKQPDPELVLPVLNEGVKLILQRAGGEVSSSVIDIYPNPHKPSTVSIDLDWLHRFSGVKIPKTTVISILNKLGFSTLENQNQIKCTIPSWRQHDISIREDLAEEIMRVYGYFRLPSIIPTTNIPSQETDPQLHLEYLAQQTMAAIGFTEIYNYSLISDQLLKQTHISNKNLFKLQNPLSQDFEYMRPSLIPSLLQTLQTNRGTTNPPIKIFELSNTYHKQSDQPLANEVTTLAFTIQGEDLRKAKGYLEHLLNSFQLPWSIKEISKEHSTFAPKKSGTILLSNQTTLGTFGHLQPNITQAFQLPDDIIVCELNFDILSQHTSLIKQFSPTPTTTPVIEDLTFTIPPQTHIGPVMVAIKNAHKDISQVVLKDIYQQNHTFTINYLHPTQQLSAKGIEPLRKEIIVELKKTFKATLVGTV